MMRAMGASVDPYRTLLGVAFASLHPFVQRAHLAPLTARGTVDVTRGAHWASPLLARMMALPRAGAAQPVQLQVSNDGADMRWLRRIGNVPLHTRQRLQRGLLVERYGMGRIAFRLEARDGALVYHQAWIHVAGVPLPSVLAPRVAASVTPDGDGWHVDVIVTWRGALVCRYAGSIHPS
jgi:uncharacterized protein DUF4166